MDDCNGTHENGNMELLMDGDYRNYCGDHDGGDLNDGNYNNADSSNLFTNTWCEGPFLDGAQVQIGIRTSNLLIVVLRDWAWFTATKWTDYEPNGAQSKNPTTHTH